MNPPIKDKVYSIDFHIGVAQKTIYIIFLKSTKKLFWSLTKL